MTPASQSMNDEVRKYWEAVPCGTDAFITSGTEPFSREWSEAIENYRYRIEPFIHSIAQFTRHRGKRVLEVGVGAGTDHLQWARAGADLYGVDLTDAGVEATRRRLEIYGLSSRLRRVDAESLPFEDGFFDVVYSWGVIHHSQHPERIIAEIRRVLKPGGTFIGMLYQRPSLTTLRVWLKHALLKGRPWRSFKDVLSSHVESTGTKAYTKAELRALFADFDDAEITPLLTVGDTHRLPKWLVALLPHSVGWFLGITARR
jgi:ubiquinone/menaquinone biosynthesis C-methylase UbiE